MLGRCKGLFILLAVVGLIDAIPTVLLDGPGVKCFEVEAPIDTILRVSYNAPDLSFDTHDKNRVDVHLTVNVKPLNRIFDTDLHHAPVREHLKPTVKMLEANEGYILHTFEINGIASVCAQSKKASPRSPVALGLRIESSEEVPALILESKKESESPADVDAHLTHMEMELMRITAAMTQLLKEADLNRDQDERFHEQTMEMVKATTFWPIVQVCVLLMTGFTQASHIVQFFKRRRII